MLQNICKRSFLLNVPKRNIKFFGTLTTTNVKESNINFNNDQYNTAENEELTHEHFDEFTREFMRNRIEMTPFQKLLLSAGSSIAALWDPRRFVFTCAHGRKKEYTFLLFLLNRHDMIACLGETTGEQALQNILHKMKATEEGQRILQHKPRINTRSVDIERLRKLPENTFGRAYISFLDFNVRKR